MYKRKKKHLTEKECYISAKKFSYLNDFRKNCPKEFRSARYHNWLENYTWLKIKKPKTKSLFSYEICKQKALLYKYIEDFKNDSKIAYEVSVENKWISDFYWLKEKTKVPTEEDCKLEASKYDTYFDFSTKSPHFFYYAKKFGYISNYTWLKRRKPITYWNNYEHCFEDSLKYKTVQEFREKNKLAYDISNKNNWLSSFTHLENKHYVNLDDEIDNVYVYIFEEENSVYVGRTTNIKKRHNAHTKYKSNDTVYKFIQEHRNIKPKFIILETNITIREGLKKENEWINYYKNKNYNILNICSTGEYSGSVGGKGCNSQKR